MNKQSRSLILFSDLVAVIDFFLQRNIMNLLMNSQYVCLHVYNYDLQLIKNCLSMTTRLEHNNYRCKDKDLTVIKNIMIKDFSL